MILLFDRFRFDRANQRLEDASGAIPLNPKAFEVLRVLIERPGQLVLKDQLLDAVWPDTHVADGVLKVCIAEIRRALGDSATTPRFIETVHRRGYRFVAKVTAAQSAAAPARRRAAAEPDRARSSPGRAGGVPTGQAPVGLVGRGGEIELLEERLARALRGERQVVFVTGEAGAGKTALVEHFVAGVAQRQTLAITGSQCLEQFGSAEAYMPVLEAVGRLVREDEAIRSLLRRYAPTWFAQLPWLIDEEDRDRLGRELLGAARERMLREMAEFVEALGAEIPLVLVLDDLHWSDPSTVDLLSLIAVRRGAGSAPRARDLSPRGADPRAPPVTGGLAATGGEPPLRRARPRRSRGRRRGGVPGAPLRREPLPARGGAARPRANRRQPALPGDARRSPARARGDRRARPALARRRRSSAASWPRFRRACAA